MSARADARPVLPRGAGVITLATALSRLTGFVRVLVVAAAMGTTFLANTYQTANTAPNVVFELVAAGVLTSVFVPTFMQYIVAGERRAGWHAASALTSVALVALIGLSVLLALAAPAIMRLLTLGVEDDRLRAAEVGLGTAFLRLFAPQLVFYGAGMIMTSALHAHRRFAMAAIAPIFNNVVVIGVYLVYARMRAGRPPSVAGITTAETLVLGAGTTLGVVAMTLCLVPEVRRLGWRFRFNFAPSHPAVRQATRLGVWALGYAGGYQLGLFVVLLLANRVEGGVAAYQWAYTFFYLPHALFGAPIFQVLFPEMSEQAAMGDDRGVAQRLRDGLRVLGFILIPIAALMLVSSAPLARVTLSYGVMTGAGADLVARVLAAFAVGLPTYSSFLVLTRAYYALGDTRTPALVNAATVALSSVAGAVLFFSLSPGWAVAGLAFGHSFGFAVGAVALGKLLRRRVGRVRASPLRGALARSLALGALALAAMAAARAFIPETSRSQALLNLVLTATIGAGLYLGGMRYVRAPELAALGGLFRRGAP